MKVHQGRLLAQRTPVALSQIIIPFLDVQGDEKFAAGRNENGAQLTRTATRRSGQQARLYVCPIVTSLGPSCRDHSLPSSRDHSLPSCLAHVGRRAGARAIDGRWRRRLYRALFSALRLRD